MSETQAATTASQDQTPTTTSVVPGQPDKQFSASAGISSQTEVKSYDWSGVDADTKGYLANKGFNDPMDILKSYRGLEKLVGDPKSLIKIPDSYDSPEWDTVYSKLGKPKDPNGYEFKLPEKYDPKFVEDAKKMFFESGLTQKQAEKVMAQYLAREDGQIKVSIADQELQLNTQKESLTKEWGAAYDQNLSTAKRAANTFGFDAAKIDALESALGFDGVMKFLHQLGTKTGEHAFQGSGNDGNGFGILTPAQAAQRISDLKADRAWVQRWANGDRDAKALMDKLILEANPGIGNNF